MPIAIKSLIKREVPDSKIRTGMKMNNIMWGFRVSIIEVDCPKTPKLSLK